jgi:hypothetical protein
MSLRRAVNIRCGALLGLENLRGKQAGTQSRAVRGKAAVRVLALLQGAHPVRLVAPA